MDIMMATMGFVHDAWYSTVCRRLHMDNDYVHSHVQGLLMASTARVSHRTGT